MLYELGSDSQVSFLFHGVTNYITEIRNQLSNIRQNNPNLSIVENMNQLLQFDFKQEKDTVDEFEDEDEVLLNWWLKIYAINYQIITVKFNV